MADKNKDLLSIISGQLDEIVGNGASDREVEAFFSDLFEDLSVRRAYLKGYLDNPQEYLAQCELESQEIKNGPLVGILVTGIFTSFSGGLLLGAIAVAAGLIQYWLRPQSSGGQEGRKSEPRSVSVFEGSTGGEIAKFGETIPAIFTSVSSDPTGGVQTAGKLIHSRVSTANGVQTLFVRYCLSLGVVGQVDVTKTLLNDQPLSNFDPTSITLSWRSGNAIQTAPPQFNFHSQNITLSNNNISNTRLMDENATVLAGNTAQIQASESEYSLYDIGGRYQFYTPGNTTAPIYFKVINKFPFNPGGGGAIQYYVTLDNNLLATPNGKVFRNNGIIYRTTKRITRLDLNFSVSVYARNNDGVLVNFATLYQIEIKRYNSNTWLPICNLFCFGKNPNRVLKALTLDGLPLGVYDLRISPLPYAIPQFTIELQGSGVFNTFNTTVGDLSLTITVQGYSTNLSIPQLNAFLDQSSSRVPDNSCQRDQSLLLRSVNEIEPPRTVESVNLPGYCTAEGIVTLNEAISGQISFTWFVAEGIILRSPRLTGITENGSNAFQLQYSPGVPAALNIATSIVRNLDKRKESSITTVVNGGTLINVQNPIDLEAGDRWLIFEPRSSCLWAEIYASLVDEPKYGISRLVVGDYYLDWDSLRGCADWCNGNNEHGDKFYWHGIISQSIELATLNAEQCRKSLLQPWRGNGQAGFYPLLTPPISAMFNDANASNLRLEYTTNDQNPINTISLVFLKQEHQIVDNAIKFQPQTITVQTWAARKGLVPITLQNVDSRNCTSQAQAIKTALIFLNIARYSSRVTCSLEAKTIESMSLELGHRFRLYTASTDYYAEQSGVIVEMGANPLTFRLDKEFTLVNSITTTSNVSGFFDANVDVFYAGVRIGDLIRNRETGVVSTITGFGADSRNVLASPTVPADTYYEIADMTTSDLVAFIASGTNTHLPCPFTTAYVSGHIWITLLNNGSFYPTVGDVVGIGTNNVSQRLFQAIGVELSANDENASVSVTGVNWDPDLYNYGDITIITRDQVLNEAP